MASDAAPTPGPHPAARALPLRVWLPAGVALAALVGFLGWLVAQPSPSLRAKPSGVSAGASLPHVPTGKAAPAFDLPNLRGGPPVTLADQGTPVVVNFFASWCHGCQAETDAFAAEARAARGRVDFVGIDTNETSKPAARRMLARAGATYPVGVDDKAVATAPYDVQVLPTTVYIAGNGTVVGESFGELSKPALRRWVRRLEG